MLTLFSINLPEAAVQRDKGWSNLDTTLLKVSADRCFNFCFEIFSISRSCSKYRRLLHDPIKKSEEERDQEISQGGEIYFCPR